MSVHVGTPAASQSPAAASPSATQATSGQDASQGPAQVDRVILEYLRSRGHTAAEKALLDAIDDSSPTDVSKDPETVSAEDLIKKLAVFVQKPSRPGENILKESGNVLHGLDAMGNPSSIQNLIASIGAVGAEEVLSLDPTDRQDGFRELESWVDGSLDMYRPELRPILFPIFCHFYLDLIQHGFKEAALKFKDTFAPSISSVHYTTLHHLTTLQLPVHVQNDDLAQRFRNEKYVVRMSRSGFNLLVGWLTEGMGGEALGVGAGFSGESGKRGRAAVMRVVNNHLRFDVTTASSASILPTSWEENTGLLSSLTPQTSGSSTTITDHQAFNASTGDLKLGPPPIAPELRNEAERVLQEQAMMERDPTNQFDLNYGRPPLYQGMVAPTEADLLPHPPNFRTIDVEREVERVHDARKRIRLEPSALHSIDPNSPQATAAKARALPSICAYTLHDVAEGSPCCTFSPDTSLFAAGFAESYIRLWNLKGEKLKGLRSDFQSSAVKDASSLRKLREKKASTTRKLIGHSGPVYSLSFDPPTEVIKIRASRDRTARLWSTDRTSCLRVYAGHLSDVDCLQFHPNSLYLATGSNDWTARLWDVQRGTCMRVFIGHQGAISSLAISPDGRYLASAGEDLAINLWDLGSGRRIKKMTGHTSSIYSLAFSAESTLLVSGGADWTVRCWEVKAAGGSRSSETNGGGSFSTTNGYVYGEDSLETSDLIATFPTKRTPITNIQFTPRNLCLVGGTYMPPETR
ncbi:hypothetical protein ONZ45_g12073 [Pleurotus djamor]|nr:hypothetical protein ONZ45_g12073 [Pleurotus djamor]